MTKNLVIINLLFLSSFTSLLSRDFATLYQQSTLSPKQKRKALRPATDALELQEEQTVFILPVELFKKGPYHDALRAYYKGKKYTLHDGIFSFEAPKKTDEFELIIGHVTAPLELPFTGIVITTGKPYHRYSLKQQLDYNAVTHSRWHVEESTGIGPLTLPENTLVINLDPQYIKTIITEPWPHDHPSKLFPRLVIDNTLTLNNDELVKSALSSLDSDPFYETQRLAFTTIEKKPKEKPQEKDQKENKSTETVKT